ncbi:MAG: anti-sigma factor [Pseudomonadota bacterium]
MNQTRLDDDLLDRLTERALGQLSEHAEQQLIGELRAAGLIESAEQTQTEIEQALAAIINAELARAGAIHTAPMPDDLIDTLQRDADRFFADTASASAAEANAGQAVASLNRARRDRVQRHDTRHFAGALGWAVAAVLAVVVLVTQLPETGTDTLESAPSRLALIEQVDTRMLEWGESTIPAYNRVSGDVVWNTEQQQGYLRLVGMPANDPSISQYQLWIVDPERDANPIDGGVFDIPPGTDEIIIPIDAKLNVLDPAAFAITREQPGGVVVSDGPLLIVAAI